MAKRRLNAEDVKTDIGINPTISPVDTFAAPVAPDYNEIKRNSLANFLQQAVPEFVNFTDKERKLRAKQDAQKSMEFDFKTNGMIGYAEAREKGLLDVRSDPTVKLAYNEALGRAMANEMRDEIQQAWRDNFNALQQVNPADFSNWYQGMLGNSMQKHGDLMNAVGVRGELNRVMDGHFNQLKNTHNEKNFAWTQEQLGVNYMGSLNSALEQVDMTDSTAVADAINAHNDNMFANHSSYTGTNINEYTAKYISNRIKATRNPLELGALTEALKNIKAGSGTLQNTNHWKLVSSGLEVEAADALDTLNAKNYQKQSRERAKDTRTVTNQAVTFVQDGGNIEDFPFEDFEGGSLNQSDLLDIKNTVMRATSIERPMTAQRRMELEQDVAELNPYELDEFMTDVRTGKSKYGTDLTMSEISTLQEAVSFRQTTGKRSVYSDENFKDMSNILKTNYDVTELASGALNFSQPELRASYQQADTALRERFLEALADPKKLEQYITDSKFDEFLGMSLMELRKNPAVLRHIRDNMINMTVEKLGGYPPTSTGFQSQYAGQERPVSEKPAAAASISPQPNSSATSVVVTPLQ
jgi:hypothetical protein